MASFPSGGAARGAVALALLAGACSAASDAPGATTLTVLAASSLTEAFGDLETAFESQHPGVDAVVSFAGSQALATQVRHGRPGDVFASANAAHLDALASEGLAVLPRPFAGNGLVLALAANAPDVSLETLGGVGSLVVGGDEVPVGRYTTTLLDAAQARFGDGWRQAVDARIVSREPNVRLVVAKVAMGEADAAIVYKTDLVAAEGVRAVALPSDLAPAATYVQARLSSATAPELADAWLAFVVSPQGQRLLAARGFQPAPGTP